MPSRLAKLISVVLVLAAVPFLAVSPVEAKEPVGPLPTPEDFVIQQYEDFLGRWPDAEGWAYWTGRLNDGLDPSAVVEALATSHEFQGVVAPVVRLYYAHFDRAPEYDGLTYWTGVARNGWPMAKISHAFAQSTEFQATYGALDDDGYVERVYANVLDRAPDTGGRAYWVGQLGAGMSRGEVMLAFSDSAEFRATTDPRVLATMLYIGMLRRTPDTSGLGYWTSAIGGGTPYRNIIAGFLGAGEYQKRMDAIFDEVQPLTGVPTRTAPDRPALAIKIDNVDGARPPIGVELADVVYEEMVEGDLTRLMAVFHANQPAVVGPVRSIRTTDIDLLHQFHTPLLAASGANSGVLQAVAAADVINVNALAAPQAYRRDGGRRAPHNLLATTAELYAAAGERGGDPTKLFHYRAPGATPGSSIPSTGVAISFGRANVEFTWSPQLRRWLRSQNGRSHATAAGGRLAPENVVVLETLYWPSPADLRSPEAQTVGSGKVYVFTGGRRIDGSWHRAAATDPIELFDHQGKPIALTRGQTFVELAPPGTVHPR
jgi:hypothetical protein